MDAVLTPLSRSSRRRHRRLAFPAPTSTSVDYPDDGVSHGGRDVAGEFTVGAGTGPVPDWLIADRYARR